MAEMRLERRCRPRRGGGCRSPFPNSLSTLKVGTHALTLQVSDGVNSAVATILVTIIDKTATLAPVSDKTILWPPNKQMVPVTIQVQCSSYSRSV